MKLPSPSLQARLTLWSVLVMTVLVGAISAVDLNNAIQYQFSDTLKRAESTAQFCAALVRDALARGQELPIAEVLKTSEVSAELAQVLPLSQNGLEIAVCDRDNRILADSTPISVGEIFTPYPDFRSAAESSSITDKLRMMREVARNYQSEQALGPVEGAPLLWVRVVISPALIRSQISPEIARRARFAIFSIGGAVLVALLFSTIAFRPLGRVGQMLDLAAKGEIAEPQQEALPAGDEFSEVASKVTLLGQQLRGARTEYTELRGNLERLLEDLEDAVLIFGRERRLVLASGAVERFLGRRREDLIGQTLTEVFPPNTPIGLLLQAAQSGRSLLNRRVPIARPDDSTSLIALLSVDTLESFSAASQQSGMMVRLRDPEAQRQLGRQLQTADRLSAMSKVMGGVAHEVKNPLNAILMHIELARMKTARGDHEIEPHMETIANEILRLDRVVKTFLDFTRPVELHLQEVELEPFLNSVLDLARPQADSSGIGLVCEFHSAGAVINADADLLKQAILNIVVNALEAMPEGGELRLASAISGDEAELRISDTGPGISPELREKIFRLYFTTKKGGTGIGLAMTFRIVQLHDGTIDFTSEPGRGTTFVLRLPIAG